MHATCNAIMRDQRGVITRAQALAAGVPRRSIDRACSEDLWTTMYPGGYRSSATSCTWQQRVTGACFWAGPHAVASHRSAAHIYGLDGIRAGVVEISTTRQLSARGVVVHRSHDWIGVDETIRDGIAVTTVHRTLIDLVVVVAPTVVEIALDSALSQGLTSVAFLWRRLNRLGGRGRAGSAALRAMLADRAGLTQHAQNGAETKLVRSLKAAGIHDFQRQFRIFDGDEFVARPDLAWPGLLVAVELDGWRWHMSTSARRRDAKRQNAIERLGWTVLRFFWEDVLYDRDYMVGEIKRTLSTRLVVR